VRVLRVEVLAGPDAGLSRVAQGDRLTVGTAEGNDLVLTDPTASRFHVELVRGPLGIEVLDHGSTNGTVIGGARIRHGWVGAGAVLALGRTQLRVSDADTVVLEVLEGDRLCELRGTSSVMRRLMARIASVGESDVPVLIVGETGTGKELIARALHELSARAGGPFVTVDCGALAPQLIASELFGHAKGAYTGAEGARAGAFARAHGGTLFLDEIGELPLTLQPTLLGALERKRFRPVGAEQEVTSDLRVVAATNRDLREEVNSGSFRLDLYYRLAVVSLLSPPLRDRPEDVPLLLEHFLAEAGHDGPVETIFPPDQLEALQRHRWPGNVRELRNLVEATLAIGEVPALDGAGPGGAAGAGGAGLEGLAYGEARARVLRDFETQYLTALLARTGGNVSRAAREARMNRSYLIELLRKLDIH